MWIETSSALRMASKIDGLNPPDTSATNTMKIRIPFGSLSGGKGGGRGSAGGGGGGGGGEEEEEEDDRYKLLFAS